MSELAQRAVNAVLDYGHWRGEVKRLTGEIRDTTCPHEDPYEEETGAPAALSCFRAAGWQEVEEDSPLLGKVKHREYRTLKEVSYAVRDCPECSRLCRLISERYDARKRFAVAKRELLWCAKAIRKDTDDE